MDGVEYKSMDKLVSELHEMYEKAYVGGGMLLRSSIKV